VKTTDLADLFPGIAANVIGSTFDNIEKAEELIAAKKRQHPDKVEVLDSTFMALVTPDLLRGKHPRLYEHHVNELLERAVRGVTGFEFGRGTKAEALCALLGTATKAPLTQDYSALTNKLFKEIFGELPGGGTPTPESYPGAAEEILSEVCRLKLRDPNRKLK
jgi:hypothetical protein